MSENLRASHLQPQAQNITPANFLTIPRNAFIRLRVRNRGASTNTFTITGAILRPNGQQQLFTFTFPSIAAGSTSNKDIITPEGLLVGLHLFSTDIITNNLGLTIQATLRVGDTNTSTEIAYIGSFYFQPGGRSGYPYYINPANRNQATYIDVIQKIPASGDLPFTITPIELSHIEYLFISIVVITNATIIDRRLQVLMEANGQVIAESPTVQTASTTRTYCIGHYGEPSIERTNFTIINMPKTMSNAGINISFQLLNGQVTDSFDNVQAYVKVNEKI